MRTYVFLLTFLYANLVFGQDGGTRTAWQETPANSQGIVYYLDGAGGGSLLTNWAPPVRQGLKRGGFTGEFQEFVWHTGLGVLADQTAAVDYKRSKAKILAGKIAAYKRTHPNAPVTLIGLSAGTAVMIFTLEALPGNSPVQNVFLIGSSMDARYNLSSALSHVAGTFIVYTSDRDEILNALVPMAGTADRQYVGTNVAGLSGFHIPWHANDETRTQYRKVKNIPWNARFALADDHGGHTDKTNPRFVQQFICPLILASAPVRQTLPKTTEPSAPMAPQTPTPVSPSADTDSIGDLTIASTYAMP